MAEWLATEVMPMIKDLRWDPNAASNSAGDPSIGGVPLWLRRSVGGGFVVIMLTGTLVLKFLTHWALVRVRAARQTLQRGEHRRALLLAYETAGLVALKVAYLLLVAALYGWLFGFSQQRAGFVALLKQEQVTAAVPALGFQASEDGVLKTQDALPQTGKDATVSDGIGSMAYATLVCYTTCWCIHALLLFFPAHGFSKRLRFARFDPEATSAEAEARRRERVHLNRRILLRINEEPDPGIKQALVDQVRPILNLIRDDAALSGPDSGAQDSGAPNVQPQEQPGPQGQPPSPHAGHDPANATPPQSPNVFDQIFGPEGQDQQQAA